MPDDKGDGKTSEKKAKIMEVRISPSKKSNDAAYQALVKTCKDSENEEDDHSERKLSLDTTDEIAMSESNVAGTEQYEDEQYETITDQYFPNDAITLKVINDQIGNYSIPLKPKDFLLIINRFCSRFGISSTSTIKYRDDSSTNTTRHYTCRLADQARTVADVIQHRANHSLHHLLAIVDGNDFKSKYSTGEKCKRQLFDHNTEYNTATAGDSKHSAQSDCVANSQWHNHRNN